MSTLQEIETAVEVLPPSEQEALIRFLTERLELKASSARPYRTRTHPGGLRPGIVPDKLGQLDEDY